ncbi:MAG: SdpI family protein [Spirochaetales bacterium]|uniref:SdpI family protein n=1 Tax=Candidatus Thalassospirochaeta sargassi TaxID=3119039 RepID=A0AAJ1I9L2_9SPIO|nr:SdpI family protein [Spirochaetales bacterium]
MYDGIWFITIGIIYVVFGLPLFFKKIKPNKVFGLRTQDLRNNPELWYKRNKIAGKYLIVFGVISVVINTILMIFLENLSSEKKQLIATIVIIFPVVISIIISMIVTKKEL